MGGAGIIQDKAVPYAKGLLLQAIRDRREIVSLARSWSASKNGVKGAFASEALQRAMLLKGKAENIKGPQGGLGFPECRPFVESIITISKVGNLVGPMERENPGCSPTQAE